MHSPLNMSRGVDTHMRMGTYEKCKLRWQVLYFTASRYWYRWSKYVTWRSACLLVVLFLSYFSYTDDVNSVTGNVLYRIQNQFGLHDHEETRLIIGSLLLEQEKYEQALKGFRQSMSLLSEQLNNLNNAFRQINESKESNPSPPDGDDYTCERFDQVKGDINTLKLVIEKLQHDIKIASNMEITPILEPVKVQPVVHNLASRHNGAHVIAGLSSQQLVVGSLARRFYSILFEHDYIQWPITDRSVIISGDAFCFHGSDGFLTIELTSPAAISKVVYEHAYWTGAVPISAPKKYTVQSCTNDACISTKTLGLCEYKGAQQEIAQECELEKSTEAVSRIKLHFLSNHGQNYTCIYNVKVF